MINRDRLLERFLRYVGIDTTANPNASSYPSSEGQRILGRLLVDELAAMGLGDAYQDQHGLVHSTIPASVPGDLPVVALVAHMDTSPEAPGQDVNPQIIESYPGGDIVLPNGMVIAPSACPDLNDLVGQTLVTTDGKTLLGGDDKAGVAIIMELAHTLVESRSLAHGPVRILMTCDEEIGHGTDYIPVRELGATVAYTLDGGGSATIDNETFSADAATVTFNGYNIHPAIAKNRMLNSIRAAADFIHSLPRTEQSPETTDGRTGFIHVHDVAGGVGQTKVELILRSFETGDLAVYADQVRSLAIAAASGWPGVKGEVATRQQYRNLRDGLAKLPEALELAEQAFMNLRIDCRREIVRGGTDGSQLTEKGLPTPNLSSGQHNIHSVLEFASLDEMVTATTHLIELLRLWSLRRS